MRLDLRPVTGASISRAGNAGRVDKGRSLVTLIDRLLMGMMKESSDNEVHLCGEDLPSQSESYQETLHRVWGIVFELMALDAMHYENITIPRLCRYELGLWPQG